MAISLHAIKVPQRVAGNVALDFVNTVDYWIRPRGLDYFAHYPNVLAWCWRVGIVSEEQAEQWYADAAAQPAEADAVVREARELREMLYALFHSIIEQQPLHDGDLQALNAVLSRLLPHRRLAPAGQGYCWIWDATGNKRAALLGPIALGAAELLASNQLEHLRQCARCGWLFLDMSRNRQRRWCSMHLCGNKVKSRRQYERKQRKS